MTIKSIILSILVLSYLVPFSLYYLNRLRGKQSNARFAFLTNAVVFFGTLLIANILLFRGQVYASSLDPEVVATTQTALSNVDSWRYIAAALSTGLSCIGAGIAVASAASAALGALKSRHYG